MKECFMEKIKDGEDSNKVVNMAMQHYIDEFLKVVNESYKVDTPFIVAALMIVTESMKQDEFYDESAKRVVRELLKNTQVIEIKGK